MCLGDNRSGHLLSSGYMLARCQVLRSITSRNPFNKPRRRRLPLSPTLQIGKLRLSKPSKVMELVSGKAQAFWFLNPYSHPPPPQE